MPDTETLQLGTVAILFLLFIKEFFAYLKSKKSPNGTDKELLKQVTLMNENHLNSICKEIKDGNQNVVNAITIMNRELGDKIDLVGSGISRLIGRGDTK